MKNTVITEIPLDRPITPRYTGNDNYGRPKADYLTKISEMDDEQIEVECYQMIFQSARCNNNPRSDWHWMVDSCYDEAKKRDENARIYDSAYKQCYRDHIG
jgi:hypothetical protein